MKHATGTMTAIVVTGAGAPAGDLRIPLGIGGIGGVGELDGFRAWTYSARFPETGRIDFLNGDVEVDMSPEDLHTHGTLKSAVTAELFALVAKQRRGYVFVDRTRVTSVEAALSVEPDVVVVLFSSLDAGRVRQVPAARRAPGRFIELEGAPDLVVEILSDSSEHKDTEQLPVLYARAGVPELWLMDARGSELSFHLFALERGAYQPVEPGAGGWMSSPVLGVSCRITRQPAPHAGWLYSLEQRGPIER